MFYQKTGIFEVPDQKLTKTEGRATAFKHLYAKSQPSANARTGRGGPYENPTHTRSARARPGCIFLYYVCIFSILGALFSKKIPLRG